MNEPKFGTEPELSQRKAAANQEIELAKQDQARAESQARANRLASMAATCEAIIKSKDAVHNPELFGSRSETTAGEGSYEVLLRFPADVSRPNSTPQSLEEAVEMQQMLFRQLKISPQDLSSSEYVQGSAVAADR